MHPTALAALLVVLAGCGPPQYIALPGSDGVELPASNAGSGGEPGAADSGAQDDTGAEGGGGSGDTSGLPSNTDDGPAKGNGPWPYTQVVASGGITLLLCTDGTIDGFGVGVLRPIGGDYTRVSVAASTSACALRADGEVDCVGRVSSTPAGPFSDVATYGLGACGLRTDGSIECWGQSETRPAQGVYTMLSAGLGRTCALDSAGEVVCWQEAGDAGEPALQYGPPGPFRQIASTDTGGCARADSGLVTCWGDTAERPLTPPSFTFAWIAAGGASACGIEDNGALTCWGQLSLTPEGTWAAVAVGSGHVCALANDGHLECWGWGDGAVPPDDTCTGVEHWL